jgi:hypothetical protein
VVLDLEDVNQTPKGRVDSVLVKTANLKLSCEAVEVHERLFDDFSKIRLAQRKH